jgi:hypothetical protein
MNGYSAAGMSLFSDSSLTGNIGGETPEARRKRLAAIANSNAARSLSSPAGSALALGGYGAGLLG